MCPVYHQIFWCLIKNNKIFLLIEFPLLKSLVYIISNHYKSHLCWWNYLHLPGKTQLVEQVHGDILMPTSFPSLAHLSWTYHPPTEEAANLLAVSPDSLLLTLTVSPPGCVNSASYLGLVRLFLSTFTNLVQICMVAEFFSCPPEVLSTQHQNSLDKTETTHEMRPWPARAFPPHPLWSPSHPPPLNAGPLLVSEACLHVESSVFLSLALSTLPLPFPTSVPFTLFVPCYSPLVDLF